MEERTGLGSEHPLCDRIQTIMIFLFFIVWGFDTLSHFISRQSSVLINVLFIPLLILPAILCLFCSLYLIGKSHKMVFGEQNHHIHLINSGVYGFVRHPMYLGILLFCLSFLFFSLSLASLVIYIIFFFVYEKMTLYEEKDLIRILGKEYITYQNNVPKWFPIPRKWIKKKIELLTIRSTVLIISNFINVLKHLLVMWYPWHLKWLKWRVLFHL